MLQTGNSKSGIIQGYHLVQYNHRADLDFVVCSCVNFHCSVAGIYVFKQITGATTGIGDGCDCMGCGWSCPSICCCELVGKQTAYKEWQRSYNLLFLLDRLSSSWGGSWQSLSSEH